MKIAICGAGVAGPTLAYWLLRAGHAPTLIEIAPRLRAGGYMIDLWGVGYTVAERMGLTPQLKAAGYRLRELQYLAGAGRRAAGLSAATLRRELGERFISLPRGELATILFRAVEGRVESLFGETIASCEEGADGVRVTFATGAAREFDLVIGADGLHSRVRALAFGPEERFETSLGYHVAAFQAPGYRPRDELTYVSYGGAGRQIARFAERGDQTMFLMVFAADLLPRAAPASLGELKEMLTGVFASVAWREWPDVARALATANEVYFDRVSQINMNSWSKDRIALVGDAAACISLVAGEGAGLGMAEAYVLAGELAASGGDYVRALGAYEARLRRFIEGKQRATRSFAGAFTPRTALGVWLRNQAMRLMAIPGVPGLLIGAQLSDDLKLPEYGF